MQKLVEMILWTLEKFAKDYLIVAIVISQQNFGAAKIQFNANFIVQAQEWRWVWQRRKSHLQELL